MVTSVSPVQSSNAYSPMLVTAYSLSLYITHAGIRSLPVGLFSLSLLILTVFSSSFTSYNRVCPVSHFNLKVILLTTFLIFAYSVLDFRLLPIFFNNTSFLYITKTDFFLTPVAIFLQNQISAGSVFYICRSFTACEKTYFPSIPLPVFVRFFLNMFKNIGSIPKSM